MNNVVAMNNTTANDFGAYSGQTGGSFTDHQTVTIGDTANCATQWWYPQYYSWPVQDYTAERAKAAKGWIEGFLEAKDGRLTKTDIKKIIEKLDEI